MVRAEIRSRGPIPVARFMSLALHHPTLGYYQRREPFGAGGDFVSAPETSQMFGEIVGLWLAQAWAGLGRPRPVRLVELGPGRGTMMADMLRALATVPDLRASLEVHLVETSARLRALQRARLGDTAVTWHDSLDAVPPGSMLLVANEFLDALPVHQLVWTGEAWAERCVGVDPQGALAFVDAAPPAELEPPDVDPTDLPAGAVAEVSPARRALGAALGARLAAHPGVALLIDYGAWPEGPTGDTLQAVRAHRPWPPLERPGEADLSAQVDFRAFAHAACAGGAAVYGPVPQGTFLRALGIEMRALRLLGRVDLARRHEIRAALFRLTDASAMGELFKVLALASPSAPAPPGFAAPALAP